jgi:hypothetical protein
MRESLKLFVVELLGVGGDLGDGFGSGHSHNILA